MNTKKAINILRTLIKSNHDRIAGYETALKETDNTHLISLFSTHIQTSLKCKKELENEIYNLGGDTSAGMKKPSEFLNPVPGILSRFISKSAEIPQLSGIRGSGFTMDSYNHVIKNNIKHFTPAQQNILYTHRALIKADYNPGMYVSHRKQVQNDTLIAKP